MCMLSKLGTMRYLATIQFLLFTTSLLIAGIDPYSDSTEVFQTPELEVMEGESTWLNCTFSTNETNIKISVEWYRGTPPNQVVIYPEFSYKDRVSLDIEALINNSVASIHFTNLTTKDSGMYYCKIGTIYGDVKGKGTYLVVLPTSSTAIVKFWLPCAGVGSVMGLLVLILHFLILHQCFISKQLRNEQRYGEQMLGKVKWTKRTTRPKQKAFSHEEYQNIYDMPC